MKTNKVERIGRRMCVYLCRGTDSCSAPWYIDNIMFYCFIHATVPQRIRTTNFAKLSCFIDIADVVVVHYA